MVSIYEIAQMTKTGDVKGLSRVFQRAGDWDTRETVVAALGNIVWGKGGDLLVEQVAGISPGSDGIFFLPYLTGERIPHSDPLARGAFVGLTVRHTTASDPRRSGGSGSWTARQL